MTANVVLLIVCAVILINMIRGGVIGFLRLLYSLVAWIALIILIPKLIPYVGGFILALIVALIIINVLGHVLKIIDHIPVVSGLNRVAGVIGGALIGFFEVEVALLIVSLISWTSLGALILTYIEQSPIVKILYYENFLSLLF